MLLGVGTPNIEFNVLGLPNNAHATAAEFLLERQKIRDAG